MSLNKKVINATTINVNGIEFKSKLEARAYELFLEAGFDEINPKPDKITIFEGYYPKVPSLMRNRSNILTYLNYKVLDITYTPDFIIKHNLKTWYIETKGFKTDSYKIKIKLFRRKLESDLSNRFAEVYTIREIKQLIEEIKND